MKNRVIISGTNSGVGKTTTTIALIAALKKRFNLSTFKCGCDYIDPMFHSKILGVKSGNLDTFFYDENTIKYLFNKNAEEFSLIEGVMGYYDGGEGSTYELSKKLQANTVLLVNGKGGLESIVATILGFLTYKKDNKIKGCIVNNITENTFNRIKQQIENLGIVPLGYIPKLTKDLQLESRHLGLITAEEVVDINKKADELAGIIETTVDVEKLIEIGKDSPSLDFKEVEVKKRENVKIAVAFDKAFSFYYRENHDLLERMGGTLEYFSPLTDKEIPRCDGLILLGGYPELFTDRLTENVAMRQSIKKKILEENLPTIAECGGFMYLHEEIDGKEMVGVIKGKTFRSQKLVRFGYNRMKAKSGLFGDNEIKAHEFHYYDSDNNGEDVAVTKMNGTSYKTAHLKGNLYAGFPHLAFYSNINAIENFYLKCIEHKEKYGKA